MARPGDLVSFTLLLDHTPASNADAYDLQVIDTLPAGLTYEPGSANIPVTVLGQVLTFDIAAGAPSLSKSVVASSEADSSGVQVLIGELVTWQISAAVPAGTLREVSLGDSLPIGLTYVPGSAELARVFDTGLLASNNPGAINSAASGVFVPLVDNSDLSISGQDLNLFLGDLTNSDNDVGAETYLLRIQVSVDNIAANQAGGSLTNQASLSYLDALNQPQSLTPVNAALTLLEPNPTLTKTASPTALLNSGGDVVFTLTLNNPQTGNTAFAYDLQILDALPAPWTLISVDSISGSGGVSGITDNSLGTNLDIAVASFPPDGQLVVVLTATAPGVLPAGELVNTLDLTYTSLPGDFGTGNQTQGNPGDSDGERTGSGSGPNDYAATDSATIVVGQVNLTKTILNPQPRYAIGDLVDYLLEVALPATASLDNLVLTISS